MCRIWAFRRERLRKIVEIDTNSHPLLAGVWSKSLVILRFLIFLIRNFPFQHYQRLYTLDRQPLSAEEDSRMKIGEWLLR